ncbi:hypothetical protein HMPREF9004_0683 [Schaalia cardiffensis F0333]|uniref:Uncharacterized protein n=1 Tax=Schaalia cardiffensis F0333 TaxID=888050 RepID=N6WEF6_9ACTO|nr:hypothetical protein HMPREF9004_0683 [Schaalia cardiffensis F0333]
MPEVTLLAMRCESSRGLAHSTMYSTNSLSEMDKAWGRRPL